MVISSKRNVNIKRSLTFFDKAKGAKILLPMAITCYSNKNAVFKGLHHDRTPKVVEVGV